MRSGFGERFGATKEEHHGELCCVASPNEECGNEVGEATMVDDG